MRTAFLVYVSTAESREAQTGHTGFVASSVMLPYVLAHRFFLDDESDDEPDDDFEDEDENHEDDDEDEQDEDEGETWQVAKSRRTP